jgi:hypothetical protein
MHSQKGNPQWKPAIGQIVKAKNGAMAEIVNVIVLTPPSAHAPPAYRVVVEFLFDKRRSKFSADELTPI